MVMELVIRISMVVGLVGGSAEVLALVEVSAGAGAEAVAGLDFGGKLE
jgi:hypothetical protein